MPLHGEAESGDIPFRWPKKSDLFNLEISEPLNLERVDYFTSSYGLEGLKFIFSGGIETPYIKAGYPV